MVPMGMGNKSPNLQPVQSSLANSLGGGGGPGMGQNSMVMSIASNGGQQPMSSMQGKGTGFGQDVTAHKHLSTPPNT